MPVFILEHVEKDKKPKRLELHEERILVGRRHDAHIALRDTSVSKTHVVICLTPEGYRFEDQGSQNGTFLNNVRSRDGLLRHQDVLTVGRVRITVLIEERVGGETPSAEPKELPVDARPAPASPTPEPEPGPELEPGAADDSRRPPAEAPAAAPDRLQDDAPAARGVSAYLWPALAVVGIGCGFAMGFLSSSDPRPPSPTAIDGGLAAAPAEPAEPAPATAPATAAAAVRDEDAAPAATLGPSATIVEATDAAPGSVSTAAAEAFEAQWLAARGFMVAFPGLAPDPLGAHASRTESVRVFLRLSYDLLERPPTRSELADAVDRTHEARWQLVRSLRARRGHAAASESTTDTFQRFLGRAPSDEERTFLADAPPLVESELGLWLTATREYRSSEHRRDKTLRQLARSLIVDLLDREPRDEDDLAALEDAILKLPDLADISPSIRASSPGAAAAGAVTEDAVAAEVYRFLQKTVGGDTLARLTAETAAHAAGLAWLRETLTLSKDYWQY